MFYDYVLIFFSICLVSMPFLMIGSLAASLIHELVPEEMLARIFRGKFIAPILFPIVAGVGFPLCECAIIPLAAGLIRKKVPVHSALLFMMMAPVVNLVSLSSTYVAFNGDWHYVVFRVLTALVVALLAVWLVPLLVRGHVMRHDKTPTDHCQEGACACSGGTDHPHHDHLSRLARFQAVGNHAVIGFMDVARFLIIGAGVSAAVKVLLPRDMLRHISHLESVSILSQQILGYSLSLCSHSDAFVAAGMSQYFSFHSILAFLVISPLIDIKNTIVMIQFFSKRFTVLFIVTVFAVTWGLVAFLSSLGVPSGVQ